MTALCASKPQPTLRRSRRLATGLSILKTQDDIYTYEPMDVEGTIRFFGCLSDSSNCSSKTLDDITSSLEVDEDGSEGQADGTSNIAPWVSVNASVPSTTSANQIVILAIYYETSDTENLVGGQTYHVLQRQ